MIIDFHGKSPDIAPDVFIAPTAVIIGDVTIGAGASVWFGAVLRGDHGHIEIGAGSNVQDNCVVHVTAGGLTYIGNNVVIGHAAVMEDCRIEDGAIVGMNSTVLHGAIVGEQAMLAAGTVVTSGMQIPPHTLAAGVPAKVRKELDGSALAWVERGASEYHKLSKLYTSLLMEKHDETI